MWLFIYRNYLTLTQRKPVRFDLLGKSFMKYTIKKLIELTAISTSMLRY